jgi:excisionase family DNA binding protein
MLKRVSPQYQSSSTKDTTRQPVESFTVKRLAERWSVSERTIRRRVKAGDIDAFYVGDRLRISRTEIERFERSNRAR